MFYQLIQLHTSSSAMRRAYIDIVDSCSQIDKYQRWNTLLTTQIDERERRIRQLQTMLSDEVGIISILSSSTHR